MTNVRQYAGNNVCFYVLNEALHRLINSSYQSIDIDNATMSTREVFRMSVINWFHGRAETFMAIRYPVARENAEPPEYPLIEPPCPTILSEFRTRVNDVQSLRSYKLLISERKL